MANSSHASALLDLKPAQRAFLRDALKGLSKDPKRLSCKYFYDQRGSRLFDQICDLEEYYLTRTELAIMRDSVAPMAARIGPQAALVELGSGSSSKTRWLLDHLEDPVAYVPVDISRQHLHRTASDLQSDYPHFEVLPVCADFTRPFQLPDMSERPRRSVVYFPGSTIGNLTTSQARRLLEQNSALAGPGGGLLIGIDLQKDEQVIEAAYNDRQGVTAQFNLNLLHRMNRELGGDFDLDSFSHEAKYNPRHGRVEICLVSGCEQSVSLAGQSFDFASGEKLWTEYSHKYVVEEFAKLAGEAGWLLQEVWTDERAYFGVLYFEVDAAVAWSDART